MPVIPSRYSVPWYWRNGHLQTIWPALTRKVSGIHYEREQIATADNDFLNLDWCKTGQGSRDLVLISHGLEGSSDTPYARGMCRAANLQGWDAMVWNYRGCNGAVNKQLRYYHSGDTGDLITVLQHVLNHTQYQNIYLIGFSVGGNITLKLLGERLHAIDPRIRCAVTFSVPCDLAASAMHLARWDNQIYMRRFVKSLTQKIRDKAVAYPGVFDLDVLPQIKTFEQFDDVFTAPMFGYANAKAYWKANSCKQFLKNIQLPTLLISALNDPFFGQECYPIEEAKENDYFYLEIPEHGGHCGFYTSNGYWSELRAIEFIREFGG